MTRSSSYTQTKTVRLKDGPSAGLLLCLSALIVLVVFAFATPPASANPVVDQAKAEGVIGEQFDGYLGVVDGQAASADVQRWIAEINAKRRQVYTGIASENGQSIAVVGQLTAERLINSADPGSFYQDAEGVWRRKS